MYKKVKVLLPELRLEENGEKIGIIPLANQPVDVILDNGVKTAAYYGTVNDQGHYYAFCKSPCSNNCPNREKIFCRENPEAIKKAGYYVNVDSKKTG